MGWSIGYDDRWDRDIGYGVPATCDHPGCGKRIDRGLSYVCGGEPYGGEYGCGLHFCGKHLCYEDRGEDDCPQLCARCAAGEEPFSPTPDIPTWVRWKLRDESWAKWRAENPSAVKAMRASLGRRAVASERSEESSPRQVEGESSREEQSNFRRAGKLDGDRALDEHLPTDGQLGPGGEQC